MGKRQIRINRNQLADHLPDLLQQQTVQVVLRTRVVVQGVLQHVLAEELELLDGRRHKHTIPVAEVEEVIYDIEAPY
ncbi:hypothetical protein [Pontibacter amylolyticus]|uniref:DUF2642 domain-containing protein n=1 Tax=Pontibacter amylolyticus TaxID=1424080 RepID=A0ABQ1WD60_9BACT|nr:hypothetical protein [Pontibacter amylolyticus]GGG25672.1 hypothetical protein GCM10011323_31760 [Pontibacter amylolyticus]